LHIGFVSRYKFSYHATYNKEYEQVFHLYYYIYNHILHFSIKRKIVNINTIV
jgi:hypothetical protein